MDFTFADDQKALQEAARRLFAERLPPERVRELADAHEPLDAVDAKLWSELVGLGWVGIAERGGDFTLEAILLEEAGYALAPIPLLSTTIAAPAAAERAGDGQAAATVAWAEADEPDRGGAQAFGPPDQVRMRAVQDDGSHRLGGRKVDVPDMQLAETVVVLAVADAGDATVPALCVVQRSTADDCADGPDGVRVTYQPTLDGTRRVAQVEFDGAPVSALAGADCISRVRRRAFAGLAAESVGVAQRALDLAVAHASSREQFGRPIGSYQAIAHRIVDVYVAVELARSLAYRAAWWVATTEDGSRVRGHTVGVAEVDGACAAAKAAASDAAVQACETLIQVLGGMGMTWEHPAHRLYKRALADRWYAGSPATHRAVLAAALLDD